MQRDWMRDERVVPFVRTINNIHVVEESRHMRFARDDVRERMEGSSRVRREIDAVAIASAAYVIVSSMVSPDCYTAAVLDRDRAVREAAGNEHHHSMMRSSCAGLMEFRGSVGALRGGPGPPGHEGHRGVPLPGLPFDEAAGVVPNDHGRVEGMPGTYVVGWIKRGSSGGIGANRADAGQTVGALVDDVVAGRVVARPRRRLWVGSR